MNAVMQKIFNLRLINNCSKKRWELMLKTFKKYFKLYFFQYGLIFSCYTEVNPFIN